MISEAWKFQYSNLILFNNLYISTLERGHTGVNLCFMCVCVSVSVRFNCLSVFQFICLLVYLSICLSVYLSFSISVFQSVCMAVYLYVSISLCESIYISVYLYASLAVCQSICLPVYMSFSLSVCEFICMSVCMSVCLSISLSLPCLQYLHNIIYSCIRLFFAGIMNNLYSREPSFCIPQGFSSP